MNIAILSWLHNGNYGTVLQAYALQRYLRNQGYNVNNIDLHPTVFEKTKNLIIQRNPLNLFLEKFEDMLNRRACSNKEELERKNQRIDEFLETNLNLTKKYRRFVELKEIGNAYDTYICGSDQIWSPTYFSPSYYFDFVEDSCRKISYACSFGVKTVPEFKVSRIQSLIKRFQAVSVREESGADIMEALGFARPVINVDPTMLLTSEEWSSVVADRLIEENYMFCFFLSYNEQYWEKAISESKARGLKLVLVPTTKESYSIDGTVIADAGPSEWVSLIKHASLVATDSFHGSVFSIIHRKNFMVFKRFKDTSKTSRNTRVYNLLETYGLNRCLVNDVENYKPYEFSSEEYERIIQKVNDKSEKSKSWLKTAINGK